MSTIYIKVPNDSGNAASVEELTNPVCVYKQPSNGLLVRCTEDLAQGVLDTDGEKIYQLEGKEVINRATATVAIITTAEYEELAAGDHSFTAIQTRVNKTLADQTRWGRPYGRPCYSLRGYIYAFKLAIH